jgi:hypothetical protein
MRVTTLYPAIAASNEHFRVISFFFLQGMRYFRFRMEAQCAMSCFSPRMKAHARILFGVPDSASIQEGLVMRLHFRLVQYVAEIQFSPLSACEF